MLASNDRPFIATRPQLFGWATATLLLVGGGGVFAYSTYQPEPSSYALTLEAPPAVGQVIFSAWADGNVISEHDPSDGKTLTFRRNFAWADGCMWQAVETLTPSGTRYAYSYVEHPESCPQGILPNGIPSHRYGLVHVTRLAHIESSTALVGEMTSPDLDDSVIDCDDLTQ